MEAMEYRIDPPTTSDLTYRPPGTQDWGELHFRITPDALPDPVVEATKGSQELGLNSELRRPYEWVQINQFDSREFRWDGETGSLEIRGIVVYCGDKDRIHDHQFSLSGRTIVDMNCLFPDLVNNPTWQECSLKEPFAFPAELSVRYYYSSETD